jgi:hypothetical protein
MASRSRALSLTTNSSSSSTPSSRKRTRPSREAQRGTRSTRSSPRRTSRRPPIPVANATAPFPIADPPGHLVQTIRGRAAVIRALRLPPEASATSAVGACFARFRSPVSRRRDHPFRGRKITLPCGLA